MSERSWETLQKLHLCKHILLYKYLFLNNSHQHISYETPGASCINLSIDFIIKVYERTKARYYISLQYLASPCTTSSAHHFHAQSHPRDTMFNTVKGTRHQENIRHGPAHKCHPRHTHYTAKNHPVSLLCFRINRSKYVIEIYK